jgi:hypothetical protein
MDMQAVLMKLGKPRILTPIDRAAMTSAAFYDRHPNMRKPGQVAQSRPAGLDGWLKAHAVLVSQYGRVKSLIALEARDYLRDLPDSSGAETQPGPDRLLPAQTACHNRLFQSSPSSGSIQI